MKYILIALGVALVAYAAYVAMRINRLSKESEVLIAKSAPFEKKPDNPTERFLVVGDSLGVGVGASMPEKSIAGLLSADHPNAEIVNLSVSGSKLAGGLERIKTLPADDKFDVTIIQLGANDIVRLTKLSDAKRDLASLLEEAKARSNKVIFLTSDDVGYAPIFLPPLTWILDYRSKEFFAAFRAIAESEGVAYVDLYYPKADDPFLTNINLYYAPDLFHVTDAGYAFWYGKIKEKLQ